ncbi:hypothetical protein WA158_008072 [Blastocystis sp. Blastoise]
MTNKNTNISSILGWTLGISLGLFAIKKYRDYKKLQNKIQNVYGIPIIVVYSGEEAEDALRKYKVNEERYIGLDLEWSKRYPISLCQICTSSICIIIANVMNIPNIPETLKTILLDSKIIKGGVGIDGDCRHIYSFWGISVESVVDLRVLASNSGHSNPKCSLKYLSQLYIPVNIDKDEKIQRGNWETTPLSEEQIMYAAEDAYCSLQLLHALYRFSKSKIPEYEYLSQFKNKFIFKSTNNSNKSPSNSSSDPSVRQLKRNPFTSRREPLYENCQVFWYLNRNLAKKINDDPLTIQLKFEPHGRGHAGQTFYLTSHDNRCVVCGKEETYVRHSIVPHRYRTFLPVTFKSHASHDIVLLCLDCNMKCCTSDDIFSKQIEKEMGVEDIKPKTYVDHELYQVILNSDEVTLSDEQLLFVTKLEVSIKLDRDESKEKKVIDILMNTSDPFESLSEFYLSSNWSIYTPLRSLDFDMSRGEYSCETKRRELEEEQKESFVKMTPEEIKRQLRAIGKEDNSDTNNNINNNNKINNNKINNNNEFNEESSNESVLSDIGSDVENEIMKDMNRMNNNEFYDSEDYDEDKEISNE